MKFRGYLFYTVHQKLTKNGPETPHTVASGAVEGNAKAEQDGGPLERLEKNLVLGDRVA